MDLRFAATLTFSIVLAICGLFCIARPDKITDYSRRVYPSAPKSIQNWPFHRMVMAPWLPFYLRFMGAFVIIFALLCLYVAVRLSR